MQENTSVATSMASGRFNEFMFTKSPLPEQPIFINCLITIAVLHKLNWANFPAEVESFFSVPPTEVVERQVFKNK